MHRSHFYTVLTIPVFGFLYLMTAFFVLMASVLALAGQKSLLGSISVIWARSVFRVLGKKVSISGRENLEKGAKYIILANHSSLFDIMAIMAFTRGVTWFGREYLLKIPLFGFLLKNNGYIPMKMTGFRNTKGMLEQLVQHSNGKSIAIFPEGTRTLDGEMNRFHRGFIYVLKASKLDVLPVTLNGFYSLKPKNRFYINFSARISVAIHQSLKHDELIRNTDQEIIDRIREVIESALEIENHQL